MSRAGHAVSRSVGRLRWLAWAAILAGCGGTPRSGTDPIAASGSARLDSEPIVIDLEDAGAGEYRVWVDPDERAGTISLQPDTSGETPAVGETVLALTAGPGDRQLVRGRVAAVNEEGRPVLKISSGAFAVLKPGVHVRLLSPEVNVDSIPDALPVLEGPLTEDKAPELVIRQETVERLRRIGIAYHMMGMCPAALIGPDGRRWHSWRVLILPHLGYQDLFNAYHFDEPWDGPNNIKLLDRMPDAYRLPSFGDDRGHFTHVAIVNYGHLRTEETFLEQYVPGGPIEAGQFKTEFGMLNLPEVRDGTVSTILGGPVDPRREIPWTKPEDVEYRPDFPGLGQPGGFAAPLIHRGGSGKEMRQAPLLFYDATVHLLPETTPRELLQSMLTPSGGEPLDMNAIPPAPDASALIITNRGAVLAKGIQSRIP